MAEGEVPEAEADLREGEDEQDGVDVETPMAPVAEKTRKVSTNSTMPTSPAPRLSVMNGMR